MSKRVIGSLEVQGNLQINGKYAMRFFNGIAPNANTGDVNFPFYRKSEVDTILGMLPVSRVGTMDYLPLNISGSFVGATIYDTKRIFPTLLEDDGTLVYLRPGTNGSTYGYYYSYVQNARNSVSLNPVLTNTPYRPSFFTPNHKLINFVSSNANEVLMMRTNNGVIDTYTLALTNTTMNSVAHQYLEFNRNLIVNDPQYVMICNDIVYIWCMDGYSDSSPFAVSLYTIPASSVRNSVTTGLAKVTGFGGQTLYHDAVIGSTNILLSNRVYSTNIADKPFMQGVYQASDPIIGGGVFQLNTDGVIQASKNTNETSIRVALFHAYDFASTRSTLSQRTWGVSFTYNISTKQYVLDSTQVAPVVITSTPGTGAISSSGQFDFPMEKINGFNNQAQGNVPTIFQTNDGTVFSAVARYITSPTHKLTRGTIPSFASLYDSWNFTTRNLTNIRVDEISPVYGSVIGENLINPQIISPNKIVLFGSGTDTDGTALGYDSLLSTNFTGSPNFTYQSISGTPINGYAPNTNRAYIPNTDFTYNGLISLVAQDGSTTVYGSSFIEGTNKTAKGLMNPSTMQFTGTYSLFNSSVLSTLKNDIISSVTLPDAVVDSRIVLYYVPDQSLSSSIAVVTVRTNATAGTNNIHFITSEVQVTLAGSTITGGTVLSSFTNIGSIYSTELTTVASERQCGLTIAKYSDFTYLGFSTIINTRTTGNSMFFSILGKIDNGTKLISSSVLTRIQGQYIAAVDNTYQVGVIPNLGFGVYTNGAKTDLGTKLVFKNFGTSSAQFDTMLTDLNGPTVSQIVIVSQEVAQGYNIYFTQEVPVFLGGKFYKVPASSLDLTTIKANPANSTFYIYVQMNRNTGVASYLVTESLIAESLTMTYIGTIVTGGSGINTISTEKVTRFLTYRPSTVKRGSAIPASSGVPSGSGTRWH